MALSQVTKRLTSNKKVIFDISLIRFIDLKSVEVIMAKQQGKIYLGYEDEAISDKNHTLSNYAVNKIGGLPVSLIKLNL